jgi:UDP-2,4-diacetamido-2,4,6-trideoxy-beta-L-altropyranose hydrolase
MNCFLKVNSSLKIGSGHFIRCLNLGLSLAKRGCKIYFVSNELKNEHIRMLITMELPYFLFDNPHNDISSEFLQIREYAVSKGETEIDWIVVDDYNSNNYWDTAARQSCKKLLVIEDLHKNRRNCDLLLDMNYRTKQTIMQLESEYSDSKLLVGPKFALLDKRYSGLCSKKLTRGNDQKERVLIYFGSVDDYSLTLRTYLALTKVYPELQITTVIQKNNRDINELSRLTELNSGNAKLFISPEFLGDVMSTCTISIGAGGISLWERFSLGIYSLTVATADNQVAPLQELHEDKLLRYLGVANSFSEAALIEEFSRVISPDFRNDDFLINSTRLCDGQGAERISEILIEASN